MRKATAQLPAAVKVGYKTYRIVEMSDVESDQHRASGQTMHILGRMTINLGMGTREAAETLLHEIMHAVWSIWKMPHKDIEEEPAVSSLAAGLATVWRDNPEVLAWIGRNLVRGT